MTDAKLPPNKSIKTLGHKRFYGEHETQFKCIEVQLEDFYEKYTNKNKIIHLLNAWLYLFRSLYDVYGIDGIRRFSDSGFGCIIRFAALYEFDIDIGHKIPRKKNDLEFKFLNRITDRALVPGAKVSSISSKLHWRFTRELITVIPSRVIPARKKVILEYIQDYFGNFFSGCNPAEIEICIKKSLPTVFYEDQISVSSKRSLELECAPSSLIEFPGYERLFLLDRYVRVLGLQHGGSYFLFEPTYGHDFEQSISDEFIGWGLSPWRNQRQHRYKHGTSALASGSSLKRLIWVEHAQLPEFHNYVWPHQIGQIMHLDAVNYISEELRLIDINFYSLVHPDASHDYTGLRGVPLKPKSGRGEDVFTGGDIVIFDESGSSLVHSCIEQHIPFFLVISRSDLEALTFNAKQWFDVLREAGLIFFIDEKGLLSKKVNEMLKVQFEIPVKVKDFHKSVFIDI